MGLCHLPSTRVVFRSAKKLAIHLISAVGTPLRWRLCRSQSWEMFGKALDMSRLSSEATLGLAGVP